MIDKDLESRLLRDRIARLEQTVHAYEASIHTDYVDRVRKRSANLEAALCDVLNAIGVAALVPDDDAIRTLQNYGIGERRASDILKEISVKIVP